MFISTLWTDKCRALANLAIRMNVERQNFNSFSHQSRLFGECFCMYSKICMIIIFPQSIQSRVIIVVLALVEFPIICFGNKTQFVWLAGVLHLYLMLTLFICTWFLKNWVWNLKKKTKLGKIDFCSISSLIFTIHRELSI